MNTILTQEAARQNTLLNAIELDLTNFKNAIRGKVAMTDTLESIGHTMLNNEIPDNWTEENGCGYLSSKALSSWVTDLNARVDFLKDWGD